MATASARTTTSRRYDHLYDPVHQVSGARDHHRANQKAAATNVERIPDRANLFSEIQAVYPRHNFRVTQKDDLPSHISRGYRPDASAAAGVSGGATALGITGGNRHKFFRRPIVPFMHSA